MIVEPEMYLQQFVLIINNSDSVIHFMDFKSVNWVR